MNYLITGKYSYLSSYNCLNSKYNIVKPLIYNDYLKLLEITAYCQ